MKSRFFSTGSVLALFLATVATAGVGCTPASSTGNPGAGSGGTTGGSGSGGTTGGSGSGGTTGGGSGSGGTTGGSGSGGTTGTGGTTVVQKECVTKVTPMNPTLIDFETYDGTVTADMFGVAFGGATPGTTTQDAYVGPYSYSDGTATPTLSILAGHSSNWAVSQSVTQASAWGMGGGLWMNCTDATKYKGISFWVRGTAPNGVFGFSVNMDSTDLPDATDPAGGGTCPGTDETCAPPEKNEIPITMDWTEVQLLWSDFEPGMSGSTAVTADGNNITGFGWSVPLKFVLSPDAVDSTGPYVAEPGDLVINIDDVKFIE
jgi:hypothetical protein